MSTLTDPRKAAIGIFDSGLGGLDVAGVLAQNLPAERLLYLGDCARVPYGTRSPEVVRQYSQEAAHFFVSKGVKAIVVACNTASAYALDQILSEVSVPVFGMIEAGVKAVLSTKGNNVAILATPGTIRSEAYQSGIIKADHSRIIYANPCPLFVPLVEAGWETYPVSYHVAVQQLESFRNLPIDVALLGCTHYPILKNVISKALFTLCNHHVELVDGALEVVNQLRETLGKQGLLAPLDHSLSYEYQYVFYTTDQPAGSSTLASTFWATRSGFSLPHIRSASLEKLR